MKSVLVVALLAGTAYAQDTVVERATVDVAPAKGVAIRSIDVDNRLGDVSIVGRDAPGITLSVVKRAPDADTLERLKVNLIPDPDGSIRVSTSLLFGDDEARPIAQGVVRIDMTLEVPRSATIDVKAWNGKLEVQGTRSGANLTGHDTDILVDDVKGKVATTSTRGTQRLRRVDGAILAASTFAELDLEDVSGDSAVAKLHDGTIVLRRVKSRVVEITTTFGSIRWEGELLAGASYKLRSYKGDVVVQTAGGAFRLNAYSRDGKVDSKVELAEVERPEAGRLMGSFGSTRKNPAILEISSTAGQVRLGLLNE